MPFEKVVGDINEACAKAGIGVVSRMKYSLPISSCVVSIYALFCCVTCFKVTCFSIDRCRHRDLLVTSLFIWGKTDLNYPRYFRANGQNYPSLIRDKYDTLAGKFMANLLYFDSGGSRRSSEPFKGSSLRLLRQNALIHNEPSRILSHLR